MTTYAVIRKSDSAEVYRYSHTEPVEWLGLEFATHDHVLQADPEPEAPPVVEPVRITKLAFRSRFTRAEKASIEMAALDNPAASLPLRLAAAALRADLADQRDALHIDLTRADTRAGVQQLEAVGLLAAGRATVILDTKPTDAEVYRG